MHWSHCWKKNFLIHRYWALGILTFRLRISVIFRIGFHFHLAFYKIAHFDIARWIEVRNQFMVVSKKNMKYNNLYGIFIQNKTVLKGVLKRSYFHIGQPCFRTMKGPQTTLFDSAPIWLRWSTEMTSTGATVIMVMKNMGAVELTGPPTERKSSWPKTKLRNTNPPKLCLFITMQVTWSLFSFHF